MMKKLIVLVSIILMLATLLSACTDTQMPPSDGTTPATEPVTDPPETPATLKIGGVDVSQYTIVYAVNAEKKAMMTENRADASAYWSTEYDAEAQTATRLVNMIHQYFGVKLTTGSDTATEASEYEILIGATNRTETKTAASARVLTTDGYEIKLYGKKLVIRGGALGSMYHALDALETMFEQKVAGNAYVLTADQPIRGSYRLNRIAVIGDSITNGSSATPRKYFAYVPTVGRMCWQDSVVYNYGKGSMTMRSDLSDSYQNCAQWSQCLASTEKYDVVLIMLGTNDSNRIWLKGSAWGTADDTVYKNSARQIIDRVKQHSPNATFVIMNCPAYYGTEHYGSERVRNLQTEIVTTMKAEGYDIHLYDMYSYTSQNLGSLLFPDKLHPNNAGHYKMAIGVTEMLKLLKEGKTNDYLLN